MTEQPRHPDGRYGPFLLSEADAALVVPPKGSYLFHDVLGSADAVVAFYDTVDIPDEVCMKLTEHYAAARASGTRGYPDFLWDNSERPMRDRAGRDTSEEARRAFVDEYELHLNNLPATLDPRDVRVAAKVIGMNDAARYLRAPEDSMVRATLVHTTNGDKTVREVFREWGLGMFSPTIVDPETYRADQITRHDLQQVTQQLQRETENLREHIDNSLHQTGSAIIDAI